MTSNGRRSQEFDVFILIFFNNFKTEVQGLYQNTVSFFTFAPCI
jgi:hypothetical protein